MLIYLYKNYNILKNCFYLDFFVKNIIKNIFNKFIKSIYININEKFSLDFLFYNTQKMFNLFIYFYKNIKKTNIKNLIKIVFSIITTAVIIFIIITAI